MAADRGVEESRAPAGQSRGEGALGMDYPDRAADPRLFNGPDVERTLEKALRTLPGTDPAHRA